VGDFFLELDRIARGHHAQVVDPHPLGDLGGQHLPVVLADELRRGLAVQPLEGAVDQQVAALGVLEEDRGGRVVEHRAQRPRVGGAQDDQLVLAHRGPRDVNAGWQLAQGHADGIAAEQRFRALVGEHGHSGGIRTHHGVGCGLEQLLELRGDRGHSVPRECRP
jgi:hypothetical protein